MEICTTFLSVIGGFVAGAITGFFAFQAGERKIQIENVTQERAKWREKIRMKAKDVYQAAQEKNSEKLSELRLEFSLNLNPFDAEDKSILEVIENLKAPDNREMKFSEFSKRVALLLKHDWERAKFEAKPWFYRWFSCAPKRTPYCLLQANR